MSPLEVALWVAGIVATLFALDRFLLFFEAKGWIYYRRSKAGRGASTYHLLEWTSVLDPTQREVMEIRVAEERREDEAGDPLGKGREEGPSEERVDGAGRDEAS